MKMYSVKEVARLTKLAPRTIRQYLLTGKLKGVKANGWVVFEKELKKFLENKEK